MQAITGGVSDGVDQAALEKQMKQAHEQERAKLLRLAAEEEEEKKEYRNRQHTAAVEAEKDHAILQKEATERAKDVTVITGGLRGTEAREEQAIVSSIAKEHAADAARTHEAMGAEAQRLKSEVADITAGATRTVQTGVADKVRDTSVAQATQTQATQTHVKQAAHVAARSRPAAVSVRADESKAREALKAVHGLDSKGVLPHAAAKHIARTARKGTRGQALIGGGGSPAAAAGNGRTEGAGQVVAAEAGRVHAHVHGTVEQADATKKSDGGVLARLESAAAKWFR